MNKSRSVIIPITRPPGSITGREPQPLFHIFSPAAAAFVPEEQEDTSFVIISLTCIVLLLFAAFVAQRANWQLPSKQKAIEGERLFETCDSLSGSGTIVVRSRRRTFTRAEI